MKRIGRGVPLWKIHGCAKLSRDDHAQYGPFIVATRSQITSWTTAVEKRPFREAVQTILRQHPTVFVGLSGQDFNLQSAFFVARGGIPIGHVPTQIVFLGSELREPQRAILRATYGDAEYRDNEPAVDLKALLPMHAKPFLGTIYVLSILEKLRAIVELASAELGPDRSRFAGEAVDQLETIVRDRYDKIVDPKERWRTLAAEAPHLVSRVLGMFRTQSVPATAQEYHPVTSASLGNLANDPNLPLANLHWLLLTMALLLRGAQEGFWTLRPPDAHTAAPLNVELPARSVGVYILNSSFGLPKLQLNGVLTDAELENAVMIYPTESMPARVPKRSPRKRLPGSSMSKDPVEIYFQDLNGAAVDVGDLLGSLQRELSAVGV